MDETVLIVGAGPVGLFAAIWLARLGVDVRVVERNTEGSIHSKALGVHASTLELMQRVDVAGRLLDAGLEMRRFELRSVSSGANMTLDFTDIDSPYNFILILEQARTEQFLRQELERLGVQISWGCEARTVAQDDDGCTVEYADMTRSRHAYVIGCDGSRSTVREACGVSFDGEKRALWFVLCDAKVDWDERPDEVRAYLADAGVTMFFPLPERPWYRMVTTRSDQPDDERPELSDDVFRRLAAERVPVDIELQEFRWQSAFQIRRRLADRYRVGRVFLAGDAAHTHSPVGGQGMNTGFADAANLAWKLAAVIAERAPESLLDTYESERRPVGRSTVFSTQIATSVGATESKILQRLRDQLMGVGASIDAIRGQIVRRGSMTEFSYSGSQFQQGSFVSGGTELRTNSESDTPSVAQRFDFARGPRPGQRAPDLYVDVGERLLSGVGPRHVLLLFDGLGPSEEGYARFREICCMLQQDYPWIEPIIVTPESDITDKLPEGARVVHDGELRAHDRYAVGSEAAYLVRPDNYIAWRAQPALVSELLDYLQDQYP